MSDLTDDILKFKLIQTREVWKHPPPRKINSIYGLDFKGMCEWSCGPVSCMFYFCHFNFLLTQSLVSHSVVHSFKPIMTCSLGQTLRSTGNRAQLLPWRWWGLEDGAEKDRSVGCCCGDRAGCWLVDTTEHARSSCAKSWPATATHKICGGVAVALYGWDIRMPWTAGP